MKISEVEKCSGVPAKTIRYYEEMGLVRPNRLSNRYRDFSERDVHRLGFLHRARHAGFSLRECRHLLALYEDGSHMPADVRALAGQQMNRIERRMDELSSLRDALAVLAEARRGDNRPDYPVLYDLIGKIP